MPYGEEVDDSAEDDNADDNAGDSEGASRVLEACWVVGPRHMPCLFNLLQVDEELVEEEEEEEEEVGD